MVTQNPSTKDNDVRARLDAVVREYHQSADVPRLLESLDKLSISLEVSPEAKKKIALTGFTPKYGARQISGVIRTHLRRPISKLIVSGKAVKGNRIIVGVDEKDELSWEVKS